MVAEERETIIVWTDADEKILVSTCQRTMITKLMKIPGFEVREDFVSGGTRVVNGYLPLGSITIRSKAKGTIKRGGKRPKGMPRNVQRCSATKVDGTPCQGIASKETGKCFRHSAPKKTTRKRKS